VIVLLSVSRAFAGDVLEGANLLAMGSVGAAASRDNAAITLNPGLLPLHARYDFLGQFRYGPSAALSWGGSAMDAKTSNVLAMGLAYSGDVSEPPLGVDDLPGWTVPGEEISNKKRFNDFAGAISVPLLARRLGIGLGVDVGLFDHDRQGDGVTVDLHAGLGVRPVDWLVLGAALRDFVPDPEQDRPTAFVSGARVETDLLAAELDVDWVDAVRQGLPVTLAAGTEVPVGEARLRAGWRRDATDGVHSATAGVGWEKDGAGLDYGISVPLSHTRLDALVNQVSLRFGAPEELPPE
jgi:hypothetical protein